MKFLDYKDELHKCSQCGLCMAVCPLYEQTKNDCANARGMIHMLNGVIKGDLEFDENISKYLSMCENCDKCKSACPSEIDIPTIFQAAKDYYQTIKM